MRSGGLVGILIVGVIVGLAYKYYLSGSGATPGVSTPKQTIDVAGVKNDLIAIAQAERNYQALNSKYASLDELNSNGELRIPKTGRGGYTYGVETTADSFRAVAHCDAAVAPGCSNYFIDPTMEVQPAP